MRLAVAALDQMRTGRFDPLRFDSRHHARIQARRFHQTGCDNPLRRLRRQRCPRRDDEASAACTFVLSFLIEGADTAQKARENRLMQIGVLGRHRIERKFQFFGDIGQLSLQFLPFTHAHERDEVFATPLTQLIAGQRGALLLKELPQIQNRHEVRAWIGVGCMTLIGLLLRIRRALARILACKERRKNQQLVHAVVMSRCHQHAREPRIDRERGDLPAETRDATRVIDRLQLL